MEEKGKKSEPAADVNGSKTDSTKGPSPFVSYILVWTYASWIDGLGRLLATVAAVGAGTGYPLMTIIFGNFVNDFNKWALGIASPSYFQDSVNYNAKFLLYIWAGKFTLSYTSAILYHTTGSRIAKHLTTDVNLIETGLGEKMAMFFQGCGMMLTAFTIGMVYSWKLTLVSLTTIPWTIITTVALTATVTKLESKIKSIYLDCASAAEEALGSTQTIAALGALEKMVTKFRGFVNKALAKQVYDGPLWASVYGNMFFSQHACYALCLFYGVKLVNNGEIDGGGTVFTVLFCVIQGSAALGLIAPTLPDLLKAATASQRVISFLQQKSTKTSENVTNPDPGDQNETEEPPLPETIQFKNVSFSYPGRPDAKVINNISFEIPSNHLTAIVGPSGSGKSTIIGLLERWYEPTEGKILFDGTDIREIPTKEWRSKISLVHQEPVLFNDTILQNVLNGYTGDTSNLTESKILGLVINACSQADIHDFIEALPDGYHTRVGERAMQLSGGQIQRLAIARAIISEPKILILDEPTSNLDVKSQRLVQKALDTAEAGRTTIEIAHNLSTVQRAARILVMAEGSIVEQGTHEELAHNGGLYAQLLQTLETEEEGATTPTKDKGKGLGPDDIIDSDIHEGPAEQLAIEEKVPSREGLQDGTLSLDSAIVSRRHGLVWCVIHLAKLYPQMIPWSTAGFAIGLAIAACFPISAFLFAKLVTLFQLQGTSDFVPKGNFWALMFFVVALCEIFTYWLVFYLFGRASMTSARKYHPQYFKSMLSQDPTFFENTAHSAAALTTLLFNDPEMVASMMGSNLPLISVFFIELIACSILAIVVYWKLGLVAVFGGMPIVLCTGLVRMKMDRQAQDRTESFFLESARFGAEAIGAIRTVVSLCMEPQVVKRYESRLDDAIRRSNSQSILYFAVFALCDSVDLLVMALLFWYGSTLLIRNELSVEGYYIIYIAVLFGGQAAGFAFGYSVNMAKAQAGANRMFYLQDVKPRINSTKGSDPDSAVSVPAIEFRDVRFYYPSRPNIEILRGLSFAIRQGENVCVVGSSGCGKSTIISLVERFFDIQSGDILIGGTSIKSLDIQKLRCHLGLVSQETVLYQGSVKGNLLLGVNGNEVTNERLEEVCREANIHEFIMTLPEGYETNCGPKGLMLSGGQRQRISIARAILREPRILLLDEATSSLDAANAKMVTAALENAAKGRTTLSSTHHIEIMRKADRVLVIEEGKIAEQGSFDNLMKNRGALWRILVEGGFDDSMEPIG
ncbi:hypothetical protein ABW19_dt0205961 [Dactylella cylindrospora]|nr:hypothetical protein ABW19_dt0205961 [Dactylella cylindrospora]